MPWQDIVFAAGTAFFSIALIPTLMSGQYPAKATCVLTTLVLLLFAVADATLGLWLASFLAVVNASLWGYMACK
jgi:hypothetical protein